MADYIIYIGAVMTASSLLYMLLPEGSVRRVASLATGFLVISAILSPVGRGIPNISVKLPRAEQKDLESAKAAINFEARTTSVATTMHTRTKRPLKSAITA